MKRFESKHSVDLGNLFILGDSYSTFEGYIPDGFAPWYRPVEQENTDVNFVEQTWWHMLIEQSNACLLQNCSWSGTTFCNTGYNGKDCSHNSFVARFDKLVSENFFNENQVDTMIVFGGTNDSWANAPLGDEVFCDWTSEMLYCVRPAVFYLASRISEILPKTRVLFVANCDIKKEVTDTISKAAQRYGHKVIFLHDIDKIFGHPSVKGMRQIAEQIYRAL